MEDQIHVTAQRDDKPEQREAGQFTEDGELGSWFKVTVSVLVICALDFSEIQEKEITASKTSQLPGGRRVTV
jgi:hypothetical protein